MPILESCCFWDNLRKASFGCAVYTLFYFGLSSFVLIIFVKDEKEFLRGERDQPLSESILENGPISLVTVVLNIVLLACSLMLVCSSVLLIVGLRKDNRILLLPWIVFMFGHILIEIVHLIYLLIAQRVTFDPVVGFLFTMDFFIMSLNCYCLLCVISQYQQYGQVCSFDNAAIKSTERGSKEEPIKCTNIVNTSSQQHAQVHTTNALRQNISTIPEEEDQSSSSCGEGNDAKDANERNDKEDGNDGNDNDVALYTNKENTQKHEKTTSTITHLITQV